MKTFWIGLLLVSFLLWGKNVDAVCIEYQLTEQGLKCTRTAEDKRREFLIASTVLIAGTVADIETTKHALDNGAKELNFMPRFWADNRASAYSIRMSLVAVSLYLAWKHDKPWASVIFGSMYGVMAMWNLRF